MPSTSANVRVPQITSLETAIRLYYERIELSNSDIRELFGKLAPATIKSLKNKALAIMTERNTPVWNAQRVNTEIAYEAWGLNIADLERRFKKLKIDGIAASAASVIAMAGNKVLMSPVSMLMIHNPMTVAMGDTAEMHKAIDMLAEVKESIMNAYEIKTGMSRAKISHLMDAETWMNANKAVELGFADGILTRDEPNEAPAADSLMYSEAQVVNSLMGRIAEKCRIAPKTEHKTKAEDLFSRLDLIKNWR